jgi:RNA polymerase sigma-70 factor, ECF subfamily
MMNEETAIQRICAGDTNAYEQLVSRYHVGLIIHCERLVGNRETAEDIAQEAFIKAFNSLRDFNPAKSRFSTWLYKIATNKAIDYLRAAKRTIPVEDIELVASEAAPDYEAEETKREVRDAVTKLQPPTHRQVIEAYYWQGQSYEQIAHSLKVPINTVRTWLRRAKQQLRSDLS